MANGKLMTGSICLSEINEQARNGHSAFYRGKNDKIYFNVKVWLNEEKDQYGNDASIQLNPKKDMEKNNIYIGNLKLAEQKEPEPLNVNNTNDIPQDDDLPF
jgi:hypothetical protein